MFTGFNLKIDTSNFGAPEKHLGSEIFETQSKSIKGILNSYLMDDGALNAKRMESDWFPMVDADIFISHSHRDVDLALQLSGWLKDNFGLTSFIDSTVWGHADELLKIIDDKYCLSPKGATYNYKKRNQSTSHVHMILSTALSKMMDKTECLMLLNTPFSVNPQNLIGEDETTNSPWIYYEIGISRLIRKIRPKSNMVRTDHNYLMALDENQLVTNFSLDLSHLHNLSTEELLRWRQAWKKNVFDTLRNGNPLLDLYKTKNIKYA